MKHLVAFIIVALAGFPLSPTHARCYIPTATEALAGAKVVFVGTVISISDPTLPAKEFPQVFNLVRPVKVRFAVEHVYRGRKTREVELRTYTGGLEWGYEFKAGERYLVYAQRAGDGKRGLVVKGCGRSRSVNEATEDLKLLNSLQPKASESPQLTSSETSAQTKFKSGIAGRLTDPNGAVIAGAAIRITARSTKKAVSTTTDDKGEYAVDLDPDLYDVDAEAPGFKKARRKSIPVEREGRSFVDFMLEPLPVDH